MQRIAKIMYVSLTVFLLAGCENDPEPQVIQDSTENIAAETATE